MRALPLALALLGLMAGAARAQPSPQPGPPSQVLQQNLFGEKEPEPGDEEEAAATAPPPEAPPEPPVQPVPSSEAYDARVRQSFAAAESFRGRLDGGWIGTSRGRDLIRLQLVDKGKGEVEGAWRDLLGADVPANSGLIDPTPLLSGAFEANFARDDKLPYRLKAHLTATGLVGALQRGDEFFDLTFRRAP